MLSLHLVLVTLHVQFIISIEQDKIETVALNTIFSVVLVGATRTKGYIDVIPHQFLAQARNTVNSTVTWTL